jgi:hypothetical protein
MSCSFLVIPRGNMYWPIWSFDHHSKFLKAFYHALPMHFELALVYLAHVSPSQEHRDHTG